MGISGLLTFLKDAQEQIHISKYRGKTLGIDAYVWLHRGAYCCAKELALGQYTRGYIDWTMKRAHSLRYHGITPYLVFDGGYLPAKADTEIERAKRREENLRQAIMYQQQGCEKLAYKYFVKCVDVTHAMAYELIKELRNAGIEYIVAPYEADAQLAYLERNDDIDGIITEDSDLLVFGCKTVLYKLDDNGFCTEMLYENRNRCKGLQPSIFKDDDFRQMAILSGCDYLDSITGMGLKTAHKYMRTCHSVAKALRAARLDGMTVPIDYQKMFEKAEKTFVFQRVFRRCKRTGKISMVTLNPCENIDDIESEECIGPLLPEDQIDAISKGDVHPITKERMVQDSHHLISRSASAPSKMSFSNGRKSKSREGPLIGQTNIDTFLVRQPAENRNSQRNRITVTNTAMPTLSRAPLMPVDNIPNSTSFGSFRGEKSKYFALSSPEVNKGSSKLAQFPPTQQQRTRCLSTDSGEISSPMSSARKPSAFHKHDTSPTTSPLSSRIKVKAEKGDILVQQHKSPVLEDSDIDEEEDTISSSIFDTFAFQQGTPTNGRIVGRWRQDTVDESDTRMYTVNRSASRSTLSGKRSFSAALLQFEQGQEDDNDVKITPALKRRHTESNRSEMATNLPSLTHLKRINTYRQ